jgi:hypothetical protein
VGAASSATSRSEPPTDKQKQYIVSLCGLLMTTVVSLSALGEARLEVYVSLFTVCYFAATVLFQPRRKFFDVVGGAMFLVFSLIVVKKVLEIIG